MSQLEAIRVNPFLKLESDLSAAESLLKQSLSSKNASPFIAHHVVSSDGQAAILKWLSLSPNLLNTYSRLLERCPTLAAWALADYIGRNYGEDGSHNVYQHIQEFLGGINLISTQRQSLHGDFRRACGRLGLSLPLPPLRQDSSPNKFVNDYLMQAGAPINQIQHLAEAFLSAEEVYGRPQIDDLAQLHLWGDQGVATFLHPGLTRLRMIIDFDTTGYHAAVYLRLRSGESPANEFEKSFKKTIDSAIQDETRRTRRSRIKHQTPPYLALLDASLFIMNPAGGSDLIVRFDDTERVLPRTGMLALPTPCPQEIAWKAADSEDILEWNTLAIYPSPEATFFVFDADSGRKRETIYLSQEQLGLSLDAGEYAFLAFRPFQIGDENSHPCSGAWLLYKRILSPINLILGAFNVRISPAPKADVLIAAQAIAKCDGIPLVQLPIQADLVIPDVLRESVLELILEHPSLQNSVKIELSKLSPPHSILQVDLEKHIPSSGCLGLLCLTLVLKDQERPLARSVCYVWPGLKMFRDAQFFDGPIPENFDEKNSAYIVNSQDKLALRTDESYAFARLNFRKSKQQTSFYSFEFARPGVSASLVKADGTQSIIPLGAELPNGSHLDQSIVIRCGNPTASLDICGHIERNIFERNGVRRFSLSSLRVDGVHDEVRCICDQVPIPLFRLVHSYEPRRFDIGYTGTDKQNIGFVLHRPIDGLRVSVRSLFNWDRTRRWEVDLPGHTDKFSASYVGLLNMNVQVTFNASEWTDGAWLVEFSVRDQERQRWCPLRNMKGDLYAFTLFVAGHRFQKDLPICADVGANFKALSYALCQCYATTTVEKDLLNVWRIRGQQLKQEKSYQLLLAMSILMASPGSKIGWMPSSHILEVAQEIYAVSAKDFSIFSGREEDGARELSCLYLAESCQCMQDIANLPIDMALLAAYSNFSKNDNTAKPGQFRFDVYKQALGHTCTNDPNGNFWDPAKDILLSKSHYNWAWQRTINRLNSAKKDTSSHLGEINAIIIAGISLRSSSQYLMPNESKDTEPDLYKNLPIFFSILAGECRRGSDAVNQLWNDIQKRTGLQPVHILQQVGYIMRFGIELFAFYLLLWELAIKGESHERH